MDNPTRRLMPNGPASRSQTVHQLNFFEIQEESVVEETSLNERLGAKQHACAGHPIDFPIVTRRYHNARYAEEMSKRWRLRGADELSARRWKPERRRRHISVRSKKLASDGPTARMYQEFIEQV